VHQQFTRKADGGQQNRGAGQRGRQETAPGFACGLASGHRNFTNFLQQFFIRFVFRQLFQQVRDLLPGLQQIQAVAAASQVRGQVVVLLPTLTGPPGQIAVPRTVELTVRDDRDTKVIGSRGGVFIANFIINSEDDISPGLSELLSQELERQGYAVIAPGTGGEVKLSVGLQHLTYAMAGTVGIEVTLSASVEVICTKGGDTLTSRYRTNHKEEFAFPPDEEKNSELINMVLGKSLDQMLADSKLRAFMSQ
jgi:uncharacterized lipoprotein